MKFNLEAIGIDELAGVTVARSREIVGMLSEAASEVVSQWEYYSYEKGDGELLMHKGKIFTRCLANISDPQEQLFVAFLFNSICDLMRQLQTKDQIRKIINSL